MTKENLQPKPGRTSRIHLEEVRLFYSSVEVSESLWSEEKSKKWIASSVLAPFSEKTKARQR